MPRPTHRLVWGLARMATALALVALVAACDLGTVTVPKTAPMVVVHCVLNPSARDQVVFLERTLTGSVTISDTTFDPSDPIASGGGVPISGALVEIIDSAGTAVRGPEDRLSSPNGSGAGVYHVPLAGSQLRFGARYELHIHTPAGEDLTAFTRIPFPTLFGSGGLTRTVNRDHDTVVVRWAEVPSTRSYAVRIESPFGPFFLFTDSTHFRVTGDLRNPFAGDLQRVLIPGFRQDMLVAAVDSNFYDYYRTTNDPFTGSGIISRVNGGLGLFGSLVTITTGTFSVTADQTEPVEGRYRLTPPSFDPTIPASQLTLYVESKAARANLPDALSGRYTTTGLAPHQDGIIGQQLGTSVTLALLANQLATDTVDLFVGELQGNILTGSYRRGGGPVTYVKQ